MKSHILVLDCGTTRLKAFIYDLQMREVARASRTVVLSSPVSGASEIDPEKLWGDTLAMARECLANAKLTPADIATIGLSVHRASFCLYDISKPQKDLLTPFITWQDTRCSDLVNSWNSSYSIKALHFGASLAYKLTGSKDMKMATTFQLRSVHICMRYLQQLRDLPLATEVLRQGNLRLHTLESFLLGKMSSGQLSAAEIGSASCTGVYDPLKLEWKKILLDLLGVSAAVFPAVRHSSGDWGHWRGLVEGDNTEVPITTVVADQHAAAFSHQLGKVGGAKITLGTGMFMDVTTGDDALGEVTDVYPLIGWHDGKSVSYVAECGTSEAGATADWLVSNGHAADVAETSSLAASVTSSGGAIFVPAFNGLREPISKVDNPWAITTLSGVTKDTTAAHICHAALTSLACQARCLRDRLGKATKMQFAEIAVDGGVSANDFVCQKLADLLQCDILRSEADAEGTARGAAMMAGLAAGLWASAEELRPNISHEVFSPKCSREEADEGFTKWRGAVERCEEKK